MARRRLPSLSALRTFEALARNASFTKAGQELGVTQAAVSRQIRALEEQLSVRLVRRGFQRSELTDAGEILFAGVYRALESIEQAVERITDSGAREILDVSVAPFFSARWLTPRLMSFIDRHPEIDLRLHHSYHPADHRREGIDLGIDWGTGDWAGVRSEKILDGSLTPVVGAALTARLGPLADPGDLQSLPLLYEFELNHWRLWFEHVGRPLPQQLRSLRLSDSHALRRAALDGHGAALLFAALLEEDAAAGRLIQPFPAAVHVGCDYLLTYPEGLELPHKARAFRRWLLEQAGRWPGP